MTTRTTRTPSTINQFDKRNDKLLFFFPIKGEKCLCFSFCPSQSVGQILLNLWGWSSNQASPKTNPRLVKGERIWRWWRMRRGEEWPSVPCQWKLGSSLCHPWWSGAGPGPQRQQSKTEPEPPKEKKKKKQQQQLFKEQTGSWSKWGRCVNRAERRDEHLHTIWGLKHEELTWNHR